MDKGFPVWSVRPLFQGQQTVHKLFCEGHRLGGGIAYGGQGQAVEKSSAHFLSQNGGKSFFEVGDDILPFQNLQKGDVLFVLSGFF